MRTADLLRPLILKADRMRVCGGRVRMILDWFDKKSSEFLS